MKNIRLFQRVENFNTFGRVIYINRVNDTCLMWMKDSFRIEKKTFSFCESLDKYIDILTNFIINNEGEIGKPGFSLSGFFKIKNNINEAQDYNLTSIGIYFWSSFIISSVVTYFLLR